MSKLPDLTVEGMIKFESETGRSFFDSFKMLKASDMRDIYYAICLSNKNQPAPTIEQATEMFSAYVADKGFEAAAAEIKKSMFNGLQIDESKKK